MMGHKSDCALNGFDTGKPSEKWFDGISYDGPCDCGAELPPLTYADLDEMQKRCDAEIGIFTDGELGAMYLEEMPKLIAEVRSLRSQLVEAQAEIKREREIRNRCEKNLKNTLEARKVF